MHSNQARKKAASQLRASDGSAQNQVAIERLFYLLN
jgi:hypothetical protein